MIPGLSFSSTKTSLSSQQSQNINFSPQISVQSTNPVLDPDFTNSTDQKQSNPQSDTLSLPLDGFGNFFGGSLPGSSYGSTGGIQGNIPNDTSIQGVQSAGVIDADAMPLILMAGGLLLFFMLSKKGGK